MNFFRCLADAVEADGAACLVRVASTEGSVPREKGAWMVVRPSGHFNGTIGGGALEWDALHRARARFAGHKPPAEWQSIVLGPALGQCCGGRVTLQFENFDRSDRDNLLALAHAGHARIIAGKDRNGRVQRRMAGVDEAPGADEWLEHGDADMTPLLLFGAGHVARSLVLALAPLPFAVRWIETRRDAFPPHVPAGAQCVLTEMPQREIASAQSGSFALVMTHSHALDLEIVSAALTAPAIVYAGLIGSASKRARFASQLQKAGVTAEQIAKLHCPIGLPDLPGKEPSIIAASVAADMLRRRAWGTG